MVQLAGELEGVILQLQESRRNEVDGRRDLEGTLEDLRAQLDEVRLERSRLQRQEEEADKASHEHQLELAQLQGAMLHMKGQASSYEGTIRSLQSQVGVVWCVWCGGCAM